MKKLFLTVFATLTLMSVSTPASAAEYKGPDQTSDNTSISTFGWRRSHAFKKVCGITRRHCPDTLTGWEGGGYYVVHKYRYDSSKNEAYYSGTIYFD